VACLTVLPNTTTAAMLRRSHHTLALLALLTVRAPTACTPFLNPCEQSEQPCPHLNTPELT
jgi:hypothetical protein